MSTIFMLTFLRLVYTVYSYHLKIGMVERYPGFYLQGNSTKPNYLGIWVYAIQWLSQHYNFTYSIIPTGTDIGRPEFLNGNGKWSGSAGRLLQGDFDVLGPPISLSRARNQLFDYAGTAYDEKVALLTPALTEQSPMLSTLRPFKLTVWVTLITSLFSVAICLTLVSVISSFRIQRKLPSQLGNHVFNTLAIITNQGEVVRRSIHQYWLPIRMVGAVWCLFAVVMNNLYSTTLISHITARKMNSPPEYDQVLDEGILDYLVPDNSIGREMVLSATNGTLKKIGDSIRRRPENFITNRETGFLKVASGCCAYNDYVSFFEYLTVKDFKETGKCRVHIGQPVNGYGFIGLLVKKGHSNRDMINLGVLEMYQTGLMEHWRKQHVPAKASSVCKIATKKRKLRRLNLYDFASAFFILVIGSFASLVAFVAEQYHRNNCLCRR